MENVPNLDITPPESQTPQSEEDLGKDQQPQELYFNVLPQNKKQGPMVDPVLKNTPSVTSDKPKGTDQIMVFINRYKLSIMIIVGVIILGIVTYFVLGKLGVLGYKQQNYLVTTTPPPKPTPSTASSTANSDFTTPADWRAKSFGNCTDPNICGDNADPDRDGLTNLQEYQAGTDPNNPASDGDGIADGDCVHVFGCNPLMSHTSGSTKYDDADYIKGGFDFSTGAKLTPDQLSAITQKIQQYGLHEPTLTTLGPLAESLYGYVPSATTTSTPTASTTPTPTPLPTTTASSSASSTLLQLQNQNSSSTASSTSMNVDQSLAAKQERDAQRTDTIMNIEVALVKYQQSNQAYPQATDFTSMYSELKPYLTVATNPTDPLNLTPYVYSYISNASGSNFTLSYYSEVAGAPIAKNATDAIKDSNTQVADVYDNQRETDLEDIRSALLLYSDANIAGTQSYVFPTKTKLAQDLVPTYISAIPKDPLTGQDYDYEPSSTFDSFTIKVALQDPPAGDTGYGCTETSDCTYY